MLYWLWIPLSLLLHLITIFALIILYQRYQSLQAERPPDMARLNEQLSQYLRQLEQENEAFYEKVITYVNERGQLQRQNRDEVDQGYSDPVEKIHAAQQEPNALELQVNRLHPGEKVDQAIKLLNQGFSQREIARQLNMGVGEVQLLSNLYGRKDD